ncbi:VWA domain-containing protein [Candidatus Woesearchaeota archaeon]|nr:VWA domain-containing protein [Candidatus Woesearchaeota archaeon]
MISFKYPDLLFAIIPAVVILFFITRRNFVKFDDYREQFRFSSEKRLDRILIFSSRAIIYALLIAALAQPFTLERQTMPGNPSLNILVDRSSSFSIYDQNISDRLVEEISRTIPVTSRTIAEHNRSAIGDSILANIQGNDNVLLITDGNNNHGRSFGDIMLLASSLNTTISSINLNPVNKDALVKIEGPAETTADNDNTFEVSVSQTGHMMPYTLKVRVDNEQIAEEAVSEVKTFIFTRKLKEGYHKIIAEIDPKDHFVGNNRFMKVVKVQPKPKILFISQKNSPASGIFTPIYDMTYSQTLPSQFGQYSAIILDDIKVESLNVEKLTEYVLAGNGLFIIGGKSSFERDNYKSPEYKTYEALLPVTIGSGKEEPKKEVNVVILIDISGSTGSMFDKSSPNSVKEVEKALAVSILNDIKKSSMVGVVAFESSPHIVSELSKLSDKPELENDIKSLSHGRGTDIASGLSASIDLLSNAHGSKSIILISDGITGGPPADDIMKAKSANANGIRVYTVGVGENTERRHMQDIAAAGGGAFFEPKETERIKMILGESEKANDTFKLEVLDNHHFITKNMKLSASVSGYNYVLPKSQSQLLLTTGNGEPILSVWRFGLGRIAVLSTDDGSAWNSEMLGKQNSAMLSRITNWAVGDLSRNKDFDVQMDDIYLGEELEIGIVASAIPKSPDLNFTKTGDRRYMAAYKPQSTGFYQFFDAVVAVNYENEISQVGTNPSLEKLVRVTNGEVFEPDNIQGIIDKVKQDSKRITTQSKSYSWILVLSALSIFLIEIAARKAIETKRIKNQ